MLLTILHKSVIKIWYCYGEQVVEALEYAFFLNHNALFIQRSFMILFTSLLGFP